MIDKGEEMRIFMDLPRRNGWRSPSNEGGNPVLENTKTITLFTGSIKREIIFFEFYRTVII